MLLFVVVVLSSELRFPPTQGDSLANSPRSKHGDTNPKAVRFGVYFENVTESGTKEYPSVSLGEFTLV